MLPSQTNMVPKIYRDVSTLDQQQQLMKFYEFCSEYDQVQIPSSVTQGFSKIDAKAYVRRHLYMFLQSYRTKHVQACCI